MTFLEICKKRFSCRSYLPLEVSEEDLNYVLEAARFAPSAVNYQPWHFIVVAEEENRKKIQACYNRDWFRSAPLYIVVCADFNQSWKRKTDEKDFGEIDVAIAVEHICLAATERELGTCWVCNFEGEMLHQTLKLPQHIKPIAILPMGHPDIDIYPETPIKLRKKLNETVHFEEFKPTTPTE